MTPLSNTKEISCLAARVVCVRERLHAAARRAGKEDRAIRLVGASKGQPASLVAAAHRLGIQDFGENYVQEARQKIDQTRALLGENAGDIRWHLIGRLQSNKARLSARLFDVIQTIDRAGIAQDLSRYAEEMGRNLSVLVEVNLKGDEGRAGIAPEKAMALCEQVVALPALSLEGLMGIAPWTTCPADARPFFRRLHTLFQALPEKNRKTLSMGMSGDFEIAIEEGANLVRIGTLLFGPRTTALHHDAQSKQEEDRTCIETR